VTSPCRHVSAISLFVEDLRAAKAFYQELFDFSVIFEDESSVALRTATFLDPAGHRWELAQRVAPVQERRLAAGSSKRFTLESMIT
jgi:uncharacterized glyoxalase superfamily protein PhnB